MITTFGDVVAHRDAMLDVFTEITQDCQVLGLAPVGVQINRWSNGTVDVRVQLADANTAAVDAFADSYGLAPDDGTGGTYSRDGRVDLDGRRVAVGAYTGRPAPKLPAHPAGYAPQPVEVEDGPDPHVCANPDCDHQRAFHHDGGCMGLACSCAVFEEPQAVQA